MAMTPRLETSTVSCPYCERETVVGVPDADVEPTVRRSVALYGDHATVTCPAGHEFRTYFC